MNNIRPQDPVGLGLCKQIELDEALAKAERSKLRAQKKKEKEEKLLVAQKLEESTAETNNQNTLSIED
jgi:hypothetical protein